MRRTRDTTLPPALISAVLAVLLLALPGLAAGPKAGDTLPDLEIKAQPLPQEAEYLGLPEKAKSFRLSQVKARALLVEIFSMYCPRCQAEAGNVNRLFERLKAAPQATDLKFLAIGAGNSAFEVEVFRKKYQIPLPLFQDGDYAIHKTIGQVGTPTFLVLLPAKGGKSFVVRLFQEGPFEDGEAFLAEVLRAADLQR